MTDTNDEDYSERIKKIIGHYGIRSQAIKTMEECSELIQACAKVLLSDKITLSDNLAEEIVDVSIMIAQIATLFPDGKMQKIFDKKLKRVEDRMNVEVKDTGKVYM